jgi:hypothetical protein
VVFAGILSFRGDQPFAQNLPLAIADVVRGPKSTILVGLARTLGYIARLVVLGHENRDSSSLSAPLHGLETPSADNSAKSKPGTPEDCELPTSSMIVELNGIEPSAS